MTRQGSTAGSPATEHLSVSAERVENAVVFVTDYLSDQYGGNPLVRYEAEKIVEEVMQALNVRAEKAF